MLEATFLLSGNVIDVYPTDSFETCCKYLQWDGAIGDNFDLEIVSNDEAIVRGSPFDIRLTRVI